MNSLPSILLSAPVPDALVNELAAALDAHVASRGGLSGVAMKAGYAALRAARPDIASRAVLALLPKVAEELAPLYVESQQQGENFAVYLANHTARAAGLVLAVLDQHVGSHPSDAVKAVYRRFRGSAGGEIEKLLPTVGQILHRHLG